MDPIKLIQDGGPFEVLLGLGIIFLTAIGKGTIRWGREWQRERDVTDTLLPALKELAEQQKVCNDLLKDLTALVRRS